VEPTGRTARQRPARATASNRGGSVADVLILHYDLTSPAAAVVLLRVQQLLDDGARIGLSPFDALGLEISVPPTRGLLAELEIHRDRAAALGLAMHRPSRQPPTLRAHLVGAEVAEPAGLGASWRWRCLRAFWSEDRDLGDADTLVALAADAGLTARAVEQALTDRLAMQRLRDHQLLQRRRGIGGVPVLELDGTFVPAEISDADLRHLAGL
jgi:2-hydroxychromene-2-carboxylate isomerase